MRRHARTTIVAAVLAACTCVPLPAQTTAVEGRLKAAFVSKFPHFVEWPSSAVSGRKSIDICLTRSSSDSMRVDLERLVSGETLNGRRLAVRRIADADAVSGCQVLFLPAGSPGAREVLRRAQSMPVLTVSDDSSFLDDGGIVRLRSVDGRIRFDIDVAAAQRAGLRVSSQLLQLALTVRGRPE